SGRPDSSANRRRGADDGPRVRMLPDMNEGSFGRETAVRRTEDGTYTATMTPHWNIGDNANGGYMLSPVLRALVEETDQPDPVSITAHYLSPLQPDGSAAIIEA